MKTSIVMTTFNSEKFILKQLDSLVHQTKYIDEFIICDDCSSDNTISLLEQFKTTNINCKIKIVHNSENIGFVQNFKNAISYASGDLIFLCDHDDVWEKEKVENMVKVFEGNKDILCLGSSFSMIDANDDKIKNKRNIFFCNNNLIKFKIKKGKVEKINFKNEFLHNFTPGCCIAFRKELKEEIIKHLNVAPHDYFISSLASSKDALYFYNEELIKYRLHQNNCIGIPNNSSYESRKKQVSKDLIEKEDIFNNLVDISAKKKKLAVKTINIFKKRKKYFDNKKKFKLLFLALSIITFDFSLALTCIKDSYIIFKNR